MASPSGGEWQPPRIPVRYCAVYTCLHNYKTHPHLTYFSIPTNQKRCLTWLKKIRRMDILKNGKVSGYHRVCEEHFRPRDISSRGSRRRLKPRAVPSQRLPLGDSFITVNEPVRLARPPASQPDPAHPAGPPPTQAGGTQEARARSLTTSALEVFEYIDKTPKEDTSKRQRPETKTLPRRRPPAPAAPPPAPLADFFTACDRHLNQNMAEFVKTIAQLRQQGGSEPNDGLHSLCVKLLVGAPSAYRLLQPALALPPPAALLRRAAPLLLHCNHQLADLLKMRLERMTDNEKQCAVSLDFIDARPHLYYNITFDRIIGLHEIDGTQEPWPAKHCVVLSARALLGAWSQPVALGFLARLDRGLHEWVDGVVRRLLALGLQVRALVADPAAAATAARRPTVSTVRPFFRVDEHKIYVMYDPPRLMKLLLCNFIEYDFHFEKTVAKWDDVVQYRQLEKHKPLTLTPQLTDAHTGGGALRLARGAAPRRAARLLSRSLAAAIASYSERKLLGDSAPATVKLILKINDLFDILDSAAKNNGRDHAKGLTEDSGHTGFLFYMKSFFKALKMKDHCDVEAPDSGKFSECWQISIATVLALREDLAPLQPYLLTRRLHLDDRATEAARRAASERGGRPTCRQIFEVFKKYFFDDILQPPGEETTDDLNSFLMRANSINDGTSLISSDHFDIEEEAAVRMSDYRGGRRGRGLEGAAARLLAAARRVHGGCADAAAAAYLSAAPTASLLRLLRRLDAALAAALRSPRQPARARLADLLLDLHVLDCDLPCACFPLQYLKKLFLRLRLYDILKQNQIEFKKCCDDVKFHVDTLE